MTERLTHQRTKGPASTPAARLIELQNALSATERDLADANARLAKLEAQYDIYHRTSDVSFGGIPVAQYRCDFWLWEWLLNENPQIRAIFELGTWKGGFAWWLNAQAQARELAFSTFDSLIPERTMPADAFNKMDVFASSETLGALFRGWEPCVVFCDNGNKPRELHTYSKELRHPDSLLVVHDWNTEFFPEDIPNNVTMVYEDFCVMLGSLTRVFRLKETSA